MATPAPETGARLTEAWTRPAVAVFWDQSLLWGLICLETLQQLRVPFELVSGQDIAGGALARYRVLVVPGGWASHKVEALGDAGKTGLRRFVEEGGSYLGFCGGAGLALSSPSSLGLVPIKRMPLAERLPSASGEIWIQGAPGHPVWEDLPVILPVCVWWPSQFVMKGTSKGFPLATYQFPGTDFWIADLAFSDLPEANVPWQEFETIYGINLDPAKLLGHPAIVEARRGKGRLILSYPHLDTPGHAWGNRLFLNCLRYLDDMASQTPSGRAADRERCDWPSGLPGALTLKHLREAREAAADLIAFGERHLLWNWRRPWLLNWRRGFRGLEYGTLAVTMTRLLDSMPPMTRSETDEEDPWLEAARQLREQVISFCGLAKSLLLEEKLATQTRNLTKLGNVNARVDQLRGELFGNKMNHGGRCRELFDRLDRFLLQVLRW